MRYKRCPCFLYTVAGTHAAAAMVKKVHRAPCLSYLGSRWALQNVRWRFLCTPVIALISDANSFTQTWCSTVKLSRGVEACWPPLPINRKRGFPPNIALPGFTFIELGLTQRTPEWKGVWSRHCDWSQSPTPRQDAGAGADGKLECVQPSHKPLLAERRNNGVLLRWSAAACICWGLREQPRAHTGRCSFTASKVHTLNTCLIF